MPATPARRNFAKLFGIAVLCLVIGLGVAIWTSTRKSEVPIQKAAQPVNVDEVRARAESGNPQAQKEFGDIHAKGLGAPQSYAEAAKWYQKAADQGNAGAQTALGELHEAGQGVRQDDAEAARLYRGAAEQGFAPAQYSLAVLYVMGKGVPQDNSEALKWYRQAADQGEALAQFNLGMRFLEGKGVTMDAVQACKWLSLAAAQGTSGAGKARDELKRRMSRQQISEADQLVRDFSAKLATIPAR